MVHHLPSSTIDIHHMSSCSHHVHTSIWYTPYDVMPSYIAYIYDLSYLDHASWSYTLVHHTHLSWSHIFVHHTHCTLITYLRRSYTYNCHITCFRSSLTFSTAARGFEQYTPASDYVVTDFPHITEWSIPKRPAFGTKGTVAKVAVNAYPVTRFPTSAIYQYDVSLYLIFSVIDNC